MATQLVEIGPYRDVVIALTFLASALIAIAIAGFVVTSGSGWVAAIVLAMLGVGVLFSIRYQIRQGRDRVHPSR